MGVVNEPTKWLHPGGVQQGNEELEPEQSGNGQGKQGVVDGALRRIFHFFDHFFMNLPHPCILNFPTFQESEVVHLELIGELAVNAHFEYLDSLRDTEYIEAVQLQKATLHWEKDYERKDRL